MATYPRINLTNSNWTVIASVAVDRTAQVLGASVWVSDDASPNEDTAQQIKAGERFFIASGKTYRVRRTGGTAAQVRLMDY